METSPSAEILLTTNDAHRILLQDVDSLYCKRALNAYAEEYIIEQATLLARRVPITLKVKIQPGDKIKLETLCEAIRKHFAFLRDKSKRKLKQTLQLGWRFLLIGIVFLGIMILLVEAGASIMSIGSFGTTLREFLIILGWVALWRPAELLLYEWIPIKREVNLFSRLENSTVRLVEGSADE